MALDLGWKINDTIDGAWKNDAAFMGVTPQALADWEKDGRLAHLQQFERNGKATIITWRALNATEAAHVERFRFLSSRARLHMECFALAARIQGMAEEGTSRNGVKVHTMTVDTAGNVRLSEFVLNHLKATSPGLMEFFGERIWEATEPTEAEKKASSPPSTPPPSPAAGDTSPSTVAQSDPGSAA